MRSASVAAGGHDAPRDPVVRRVLDPAFGFFVWAAHLVAIYVLQALACVLDIPSRSPRAETTVILALAALTVAAAAVIGLHGLRRYRQAAATDDQRFLFRIAVGQDAIAALAVAWQLMPIFMVPLCR